MFFIKKIFKSNNGQRDSPLEMEKDVFFETLSLLCMSSSLMFSKNEIESWVKFSIWNILLAIL